MIDHDPNTPYSALSSEERMWASRLSQLDANAAPSPQLDAGILAIARRNATPVHSTGHRRFQRWPLALGVAASLTLAVGIAWQLRPSLLNSDPETFHREQPSGDASPAVIGSDAMQNDAADAAAAVDAEDSSEAFANRTVLAEQNARKPEQTKLEEDERQDAKREQETAIASSSESDERSALPNDSEQNFVLDAPMAAPASPPLPPLPAASTQYQPTLAPITPAEAGSASAVSAAEPGGSDQTTLDKLTIGASADDQPLDDQPPASADSPEVQEAWLQRIRELVMRQQLDAARASLTEYRRRYPEQPIPEDLRSLDD